jgi:Kef-type K+ transport system membrane component KefB
VNFGYFLLFTAVAIGITAFPVLCRILTELKLLDTEVGLVTLSAGVGNDVVGWILLALTVALVNASTGLTALWVLLASAGFTIFLLYPGRWALRWLAKRTGSLEAGTPSQFMMTVILLLVLASAFFTDIIGVHAIFGMTFFLTNHTYQTSFRWLPCWLHRSSRQWLCNLHYRKDRRSRFNLVHSNRMSHFHFSS